VSGRRVEGGRRVDGGRRVAGRAPTVVVEEGAPPADAPATRPGRSLGSLLGQAVAVAVLVVVVAVGLLAVVVPRLVGGIPLTVLTSSMEPGLPPGTLVVVRPVDPAAIRVGDVVTYQIRPGVPGVISHRVVGVSVGAAGRTFTLKGDANARPDPDPVVEGQVMGEVWYSVPWLGRLNSGVSSGTRGLLVPVVGAGLLVYAGVLTGRGALRRRRARRTPGGDAA